ncbi:MAG: lysozyme [Pseudobutyrivibrio sp.]|nr:lysozyme [Pseudobutyrivibrio sp.]
MGRPIGKKGLDLIKQFEGCRLNAYQDVVGVWTIGYGHTHGVTPGMKIDQAEAERLLCEDVQSFADAVDNPKNVAIPLSDEQRDALISFAYNTGVGNLKKLCNGRNASQIAEAMLHYNKAGGKEVKGLTRRRQAEHDLFCSNMNGGSSSNGNSAGDCSGNTNSSDNKSPSSPNSSSTGSVFNYDGLDYSPVFNPSYYCDNNADLAQAYGNNENKLFDHFIQCGMKEGRQGCSSFNVNTYKNRYADLAQAYGNDLPKYYLHYLQFGKAEGRTGI